MPRIYLADPLCCPHHSTTYEGTHGGECRQSVSYSRCIESKSRQAIRRKICCTTFYLAPNSSPFKANRNEHYTVSTSNQSLGVNRKAVSLPRNAETTALRPHPRNALPPQPMRMRRRLIKTATVCAVQTVLNSHPNIAGTASEGHRSASPSLNGRYARYKLRVEC